MPCMLITNKFISYMYRRLSSSLRNCDTTADTHTNRHEKVIASLFFVGGEIGLNVTRCSKVLTLLSKHNM